MKLRSHKQSALLFFGLVLVALLLTCLLWVRRAQQQYALNRQLIEALKKSDAATALELVNVGADPNTPYEPPPKPSLPDLFKSLLHRTPPPVAYGPTALKIACGEQWLAQDRMGDFHGDSPQLVTAMLRQGGDPDTADTDGPRWTLLMHAIYSQRRRTMETLVERGANVNARDNQGRTALLRTYQYNIDKDEKVARYLIEHGADVNTKTFGGLTPLLLASTYKMCLADVHLLLVHGAQVNAGDETALQGIVKQWKSFELSDRHSAFANRKAEIRAIVCELLANGADPDLPDREGVTALQYARRNHLTDLIALLQQHRKQSARGR